MVCMDRLSLYGGKFIGFVELKCGISWITFGAMR